MDVQSIHHLLLHTYHPDTTIRTQAEIALNKGVENIGFPSTLLQFLLTTEYDVSTYQAGSIYFKNLIRRFWYASTATKITIHEQDKLFIRENLLRAISVASNQSRVQLIWSLGCILSHDFPENWPNFLQKCSEFLSANDVAHVYTGFVGLQQLIQLYQWKSNDAKTPLNKIVRNVFPTILNFVDAFMAEPASNSDAGMMVKIAFKMYHAAIQYDVPKSLQEEGVLTAWCKQFLRAIEKEVPLSILPADKSEHGKNPWWKAKKWALRCLCRLFTRYGNQQSDSFREGPYVPFAKRFTVKFAPGILEVLLAFTDNMLTRHQHVPNKVMFRLVAFFSDSIKNKVTWKILESRAETLVVNLIFPLLAISQDDLNLWDEDPVEYVHKKLDDFEDFYSPATAAIDFLLTLTKEKQKTMFLPTLQFINSILIDCPATAMDSSRTLEKSMKRDGALAMLGTLSQMILAKNSPVRSQAASVLAEHVFPELQSPFPFLKSRACQVITSYCREDDENEICAGDPMLWANVAETVTRLLAQGEDLPVRVNAALLLERLFAKSGVRETLSKNVPIIMQEFLSLANDVDMDTITEVMESCVEYFPAEVAPFAINLCGSLRDSFIRIMEDSQQSNIDASAESFDENKWDDVEDKTMAAMGILKTINTLVLSIQPASNGAIQTELLEKLEQTLLPCVIFVLSHQIIDLYEDVFELLDSCSFQAKRISPTLWSVLDLLTDTVKNSGIDFIEEALPAFDNYVSFGVSQFEENEELQLKFIDLINHVLTSDYVGDTEKIIGFKLIESLLLNCKKGLDTHLPTFMQQAFCILNDQEKWRKNTALFVASFNAVIDCVYYQPLVTLQLLEQSGFSEAFFNLWFGNHSKLIRVHDKKLSIAAILKLLQMGSQNDAMFTALPPSIKIVWPQLMKLLLTMFETLPKAVEARDELKNLNFSSDEDDDDDDDSSIAGSNVSNEDADEDYAYDENDFQDHGDEDHEDEAQYLQYLRNQKSHDHDEEDEDEWCQEVGEELYYETPLDNLNLYAHFRDTMSGINHSSPHSYAQLTAHLTPQEQEFGQQVVALADKKEP